MFRSGTTSVPRVPGNLGSMATFRFADPRKLCALLLTVNVSQRQFSPSSGKPGKPARLATAASRGARFVPLRALERGAGGLTRRPLAWPTGSRSGRGCAGKRLA
jgi:hypothetical protein